MTRLSSALAAALLLAGPVYAAQHDSPVGTWKTIDDETGKPRSIVEITEHDGELQAQVKQLLNLTPEEIRVDGEHPHCTRCDGERHNQPIEGMVIMWGVHKDGDSWDGGRVLDPKKGKTYKVTLKLADGGEKLDVRGYIGFSLLGRTQTWERQD
ncbi:DUF2147 domain-containing protein [Frateuria aurantia]